MNNKLARLPPVGRHVRLLPDACLIPLENTFADPAVCGIGTFEVLVDFQGRVNGHPQLVIFCNFRVPS